MVLVVGLLFPGRAQAAQSPLQCDSVPKYWCTSIIYSISGNTYTVQERDWQGATDGGAERWRLEFANDYQGQYGQSWTLTSAFGPTAWRADQYLGTWWCGCFSNAMSGGAMVEMQLGYEECAPAYPGGPNQCNPWYSSLMYLYAT